jgi:predicted  nucleic acid-binding Zn-ribbon protein
MTKTERDLQELRNTLAVQGERLDRSREDMESLKEETAKIASRIESSNEKSNDDSSDFKARLAVLKSHFDEFKKRCEESDRRRWTIYGVMVAASLTFIANLVLLFLRK